MKRHYHSINKSYISSQVFILQRNNLICLNAIESQIFMDPFEEDARRFTSFEMYAFLKDFSLIILSSVRV